MKVYDHKTLGGILLIAGTAVGAGMLALPITTGVGGYLNASLLMIVCFAYMLYTLFLLLEANLYESNMETNIITMAKKRLGPLGQILAWSSFLLLLYSVASAYLSGGGALVAHTIEIEFSPQYMKYGIYIFGFSIGLVVFFGAWLIDYVNRFLMLALIAAYLALIMVVTPHVEMKNFAGGEPKYLLSAVTVVVLSFTSHIIVPTLRIYFKNNVPQLKRTLLIGSVIPLFFYLVWEFLICGLLPPSGSEFSLKAVAASPDQLTAMTRVMHVHLGLVWIPTFVKIFSFLAVVTSFLAVVLSLVDFLSDGFQIKKTPLGRLLLLTMALLPPLVFALFFPDGFVRALRYAGVFVAVLYGVLPALMVWKARYVEQLPGEFRAPGGKKALVFTLFCAVLVIFFQIATTQGWLPSLK